MRKRDSDDKQRAVLRVCLTSTRPKSHNPARRGDDPNEDKDANPKFRREIAGEEGGW